MRRALSLVLATLCAAVTAPAQHFDLGKDRLPIANLNGLWRFHTGDDLGWADASFDDSNWPLLHSDRSWVEQGYSAYNGLAWYRFKVDVPVGMDDLSLLLPQIWSCYEVYADGRIIATFGKMPPNRFPYTSWFNNHVYALPSGMRQARTVVIALRVWSPAKTLGPLGGGPTIGGALIGDTKIIKRQHDLSRANILWDLASNQALALLQTVAGLGALAFFVIRHKEREYLWFGLMMLLKALKFGWLEVLYRTQVWNVPLMELLQVVALSGAVLASLAFYHDLLRPPRSWLQVLRLAIFCAVLNAVFSLTWSLFPGSLALWTTNLASLLLMAPSFVWILWCVLTAAKHNSLDSRLLLAPVLLSISAELFNSAAWITNILGWQHKFGYYITLTQKPISIHLLQVTDALFLISVFAILIFRFARTRIDEERFANEILAARAVQQVLIPEVIPEIPGFAIEAIYKPAGEVGGDFFQVLRCSEDGVLVVIGDVSGKGMPAAMTVSLLVGTVRTLAHYTHNPSEILSAMNQRMIGRHKGGFVTCLILCIHGGGNLIAANAGHPAPYCDGEELSVESGFPLGLVPNVVYGETSLQIPDGAQLTLITDGVVEARSSKGELFGFDRSKALSLSSAEHIVQTVQAFGQEDDITVLRIIRQPRREEAIVESNPAVSPAPG